MDRDTVKKIAFLSRIGLTETEVDYFQNELTRILALDERMLKLDTTNVVPMVNPLPPTEKLREDIVTEQNERELLQSIAPETLAGLYLVPKVIE